jgi:hypothetical protein
LNHPNIKAEDDNYVRYITDRREGEPDFSEDRLEKLEDNLKKLEDEFHDENVDGLKNLPPFNVERELAKEKLKFKIKIENILYELNG